MKQSEFDDYFKNRYQNQIQWYDKRAGTCKKRYQTTQWCVIILSAMVPVLIASVPDSLEWIPLVLSILLAIGTTSLKTFKYQENWINYRTTAETLKKEHIFYLAGIGDYSDSSDRDALFVDRSESLISRENK